MKHGAWVRPAALATGILLGCAAGSAGAQAVKTVPTWSGVYTAAQNKRGEDLHEAVCSMCHGPRLNGAGQSEMPPSPAIAGSTLLRKWSGQSVAALVIYVRHAMPPDAPNTLTDQQAVDAVAHMLFFSGMPAGERELPADIKALGNILIQAPPK